MLLIALANVKKEKRKCIKKFHLLHEKNPLWSYVKEHTGICVSLHDSHLCMWGPPPLCCRGGPTWKWLGCTESEITEGKNLHVLSPPPSTPFIHTQTHTHTHNLTQKPTSKQLRRKQAGTRQRRRHFSQKAAELRRRRRLLCWDKAAVWLPSCRSRAEWGRDCKFLRKSC